MSKFIFSKETGKLEAAPSEPVKAENTSSDEKKAVALDIEKNAEEEEVLFRKFSDLSIIRVDDRATGEWLCYFSGYNLDIQFNVKELKGAHATQKIEAALEGLNKLFRKVILDQVL